MIFITATGGVLSIILIIALAFLLRQRDIEAGDVEGEGAGHNRDGKRWAHYSTPLRRCFRWECRRIGQKRSQESL